MKVENKRILDLVRKTPNIVSLSLVRERDKTDSNELAVDDEFLEVKEMFFKIIQDTDDRSVFQNTIVNKISDVITDDPSYLHHVCEGTFVPSLVYSPPPASEFVKVFAKMEITLARSLYGTMRFISKVIQDLNDAIEDPDVVFLPNGKDGGFELISFPRIEGFF